MSFDPRDFKPGDKFRATTVDVFPYATRTTTVEGVVGEVRTDRILITGSPYPMRFESPIPSVIRTWELVEHPTPAEPTGVGAVVEYTYGGDRYVAVRTDTGEWLDEHNALYHEWEALIRKADDLTVLFEGRPA